MKIIKLFLLIGILTSIHQTAFAEILTSRKINSAISGIVCQITGLNEDVCGDISSVASIMFILGIITIIFGASGAAIMKTIAKLGVVVGGGVIMGVAITGGSGSFSAAHLMSKYVYSNCQNQVACSAAQVGTYTGAIGGTVASLSILTTTGAGPAGLATIGATVGGGMTMGVIVIIAVIPITTSAIISGLFYWLVE